MLDVRGVLAPTASADDPFAFAHVDADALDCALAALTAADFAIVAPEEAAQRMSSRRAGRFAVIAFDHAWRAALVHGAHVMRARGAPFLVRAAPECADRRERAWRPELEAAIARLEYVEINLRAEMIEHAAGTPAQKRRALQRLCADLARRDLDDARDVISRLVARAGLEPGFSLERYVNRTELDAWATDPLCTIRLEADALSRGAPGVAGLPVLTLVAGGLLASSPRLGILGAVARLFSPARLPST